MASIAVRQTYKAFGHVDDSLKQDRDWVNAILEDYSLKCPIMHARLEEEGLGDPKDARSLSVHHSELCAIGLANRGQSLEVASAVIRFGCQVG